MFALCRAGGTSREVWGSCDSSRFGVCVSGFPVFLRGVFELCSDMPKASLGALQCKTRAVGASPAQEWGDMRWVLAPGVSECDLGSRALSPWAHLHGAAKQNQTKSLQWESPNHFLQDWLWRARFWLCQGPGMSRDHGSPRNVLGRAPAAKVQPEGLVWLCPRQDPLPAAKTLGLGEMCDLSLTPFCSRSARC